jgi:GNAT superfamily N-acetyltransferase
MSMTADAVFSISQFRDAWRVLCAASPDTVVEQTDGIEYVFGGVPISFFNVAILTADQITSQQLEDYAYRALAWAAPRKVAWLFVVTHDALAPGVDATKTLEPCGLVPMLPLTGMIAHELTPAARTPDLAIEVARDDAACVAALDINSAAYGVSLSSANDAFGTFAAWDPHVLSLGYVDGVPVASTAVLQVAGCRYVALVATRPDQQRRGYAEAVMRHALDVGTTKFGNQPTTLHASDAGRPIYARMGYATIASHTAYIATSFLEGH